MNVVVVSSQPDFLKEGLKALSENGLVPHMQRTVDEARIASKAAGPALVILDAEMARGDLPAACQALHDATQAPIIVVSEEELSEFEAARCFEAGAGARLVRDVPPLLLLAWAQALTRRR